MSLNKTIDLYEFRKKYELSAASARAILEKLGYKIEKVGDSHKIICGSARTFGKDDEYYLKHAVLEFRRTMDVSKTIEGEFFEYEEEAEVGGKKVVATYGVSKMNPAAVAPKTPSLKRTPNTPPAPAAGIVPVEQSTSALAATDPLTALVAALTQAPAAATDPLLPQKQLKEAEQQGYRITSQQLAELLGMSPQTISSKKSGFIKLGFMYEKVKEGTSTLWKVSQVD